MLERQYSPAELDKMVDDVLAELDAEKPIQKPAPKKPVSTGFKAGFLNKSTQKKPQQETKKEKSPSKQELENILNSTWAMMNASVVNKPVPAKKTPTTYAGFKQGFLLTPDSQKKTLQQNVIRSAQLQANRRQFVRTAAIDLASLFIIYNLEPKPEGLFLKLLYSWVMLKLVENYVSPLIIDKTCAATQYVAPKIVAPVVSATQYVVPKMVSSLFSAAKSHLKRGQDRADRISHSFRR